MTNFQIDRETLKLTKRVKEREKTETYKRKIYKQRQGEEKERRKMEEKVMKERLKFREKNRDREK
jgi:hypothetical protein